MLKQVRALSLPAFLAALFAISTAVFADKKNDNATGAVVTVNVGHAHYQQIPDYASALGTLVAVRSTNLSFLSGGHLSQKLFKNGAKVKKNDVIAKLDASTIESELASAKANLEEAQSKYDRYSLLKDSGVFSKQDYISVSTVLKVAKAKYASVLEQEQQLTLLAPFEGTLGKYNFSVGAQVGAGDSIVNLVQLDPLKVSYSLNQTDKGKVHEGQTVLVKSDTWPEKLFTGKVNYISPTINPNTGRFDLEAVFSNPEGHLSPGGLVHVEHILGKGHRALVIPQTAVSVDEDQSYVFIVKNGKAHKKNIVTGEPMENGDIAVIDGLDDDESVVVDGVQKLGDGVLVKIIGSSKVFHHESSSVVDEKKQSPHKNVGPVSAPQERKNNSVKETSHERHQVTIKPVDKKGEKKERVESKPVKENHIDSENSG